MSRPHNHRRRLSAFKSEFRLVAAELLEYRQLLSGTNDIVVDNVQNVAGPLRTFNATGASQDSAAEFHIEEVRLAANEIWILSSLHEPYLIDNRRLDFPAPSLHTDSVRLAGPNLPIRHFQIGMDHGFDANVTYLEGPFEFFERIQNLDSRLLYRRADNRLLEWRYDLRNRMIAQADDRYASVYGSDQSENAVLSETDRGTQPLRSGYVSSLSVTVQQDDRFLYNLNGSYLTIIRTATETVPAQVVSRTRLATSAGKLLLSGEHLALVGSGDTSSVTILDVSDRSAPIVLQEALFDGQYHDSWESGGEFFVLAGNRTPGTPLLATIIDMAAATGVRYETRAEYINCVENLVFGTYLQEALMPLSFYRRNGTKRELLNRLDQPEELGQSFTSVLRFGFSPAGYPLPVESAFLLGEHTGAAVRQVTEHATYIVRFNIVQRPMIALDGSLYTGFERSVVITPIFLTEGGMSQGSIGSAGRNDDILVRKDNCQCFDLQTC